MNDWSRGFVPVPRAFFEKDPWWTEPRSFSRGEAWLDFLRMAAFTDYERPTAGGDSILQHRGEVVISIRTMAKRWGWTIKKVRTWIALCLRRGRITAPLGAHSGAHFGTVYRVVNFQLDEDEGTPKGTLPGTPKGTARAHSGHTEGTRENNSPEEVSKKSSKKPKKGENARARSRGAQPPSGDFPDWIHEAVTIYREARLAFTASEIAAELLTTPADTGIPEGRLLDGLRCFLADSEEKEGFKGPKWFRQVSPTWVDNAQSWGNAVSEDRVARLQRLAREQEAQQPEIRITRVTDDAGYDPPTDNGKHADPPALVPTEEWNQTKASLPRRNLDDTPDAF